MSHGPSKWATGTHPFARAYSRPGPRPRARALTLAAESCPARPGGRPGPLVRPGATSSSSGTALVHSSVRVRSVATARNGSGLLTRNFKCERAPRTMRWAARVCSETGPTRPDAPGLVLMWLRCRRRVAFPDCSRPQSDLATVSEIMSPWVSSLQNNQGDAGEGRVLCTARPAGSHVVSVSSRRGSGGGRITASAGSRPPSFSRRRSCQCA